MSKVERVSIAGLFVVAALATAAVVQSSGAQAAITGDFKNAASAEVQDSQGNVLARGTFAPVAPEDAGEVERVATLTSATAGKETGEVEIEYAQDKPAEQEIELTLAGATPGAEVVLLVDGQRVLTGKAGKNGEIEVEVIARSGQ